MNSSLLLSFSMAVVFFLHSQILIGHLLLIVLSSFISFWILLLEWIYTCTYIYIYFTWVDGSYQLQKKIGTSKHIIVCSCLTCNWSLSRALGRFASSQTCRLLSALHPFACVLSSAHHACPLLVNLANFSFSFMSKFKYYVLCDTLSDSLLWDEVVFSPALTLFTGTKARSGGYSGT